MPVIAIVLLGFWLQVGPARAALPGHVPLPEAVTAHVQAVTGAMRPLGSGEMRWFGFKVYDAALWVPAGAAWSEDTAFALAIRYARDIEGERLVDTSIDEMRRMGFADETRLARWREMLARALPSVAAGETLVGLRQPGAGARFWHEGKPTAALTDPDLARAFFAIWLDRRTREPGLRERLLGSTGAAE
ncbi:hypothetical protein CEW87_04295 [Parazoarcus communis]|uniref:Chalcone isomerase domain-containing protein n=1 Tax=Parazoarcus communis TaxID=41977 RepID=A0A2U8H801_9RHOO|nr:chalcone isomerase family protein [Parazoarcus communis]AWI81891.1 hypothetical protein CEW87_04295 [Parazoarcus communis]